MKCFNHRELDAIAVCKHCGKAVCSQCLADTGEGVACRGLCENKVCKNLDQQNELFRSTKVPYYALAVFLALGGFGFLGFASPGGRYEPGLTPFLGAIGALFLGCAVRIFRIAKRMAKFADFS